MNAHDLDLLCINTIRFLSADGVQKAKSGHPGLPMGAAAMAYVLWTRFLKHHPANPSWPDRDRFVLSGGHGSMLLYSLLHLTGYPLSLDEIKSFRQWGSLTPGHPESDLTPGVEATTGPLGQGISTAVGMAIAEAHLAARFNRPGITVVDHETWVLASDGDLMEGVASEACSLAGHLQLGKLNVLYDDNQISLAGSTSITFTEDVCKRFEAYGWHVQKVADGNDVEALEQAMKVAESATGQPSIIAVRTTIGFGAPKKQGTFEAHGSPLGPDELRAAKENLGWPLEPDFHLPEEAMAVFRQALSQGAKLEAAWNLRMEKLRAADANAAAELERRFAKQLPDGWEKSLPTFPADAKGLATRKASEATMQALAKSVPELMGGSADLNPSTFTWLKGEGDFGAGPAAPEGSSGAVGGPWGYVGRNILFGVREHGMGAAVNGMSLHGGLVPYGATFLIFSDYMRPAIRLSALSKIGSVWVFTHDSIGLGEDGPTHQSVEQYMSLRAIPEIVFLRPADANETVEAWKHAITSRHRPTILALTRQDLPTLDRTIYAPASGVRRGAYVLNPQVTSFDVILIATGSEVALIVGAEAELAKQGVKARLVSMPSFELFGEEPESYRNEVLPPAAKKRLAVETGVTFGWHRWVGDEGDILGLDRFGASAPAPRLFKEFGFTIENVTARAFRLARG